MKGEIELKNSFECEVQDCTSLAATAKEALERVCSGKALDSLPRYYSQEFVDHVIRRSFRGWRPLAGPLSYIRRCFLILKS